MAKQHNAYCLQETQAGCVLVGTPDQLVFLNQDEKRRTPDRLLSERGLGVGLSRA